MGFARKLKFERTDSIQLYTGVNGDGRNFFAYLVCDLAGTDRLHDDYKTGRTSDDIREYGEVIYIDFLSAPDTKAVHFLEEYLKQS